MSDDQKRIEGILMGFAAPLDVIDAHSELYGADSQFGHDLREVRGILAASLPNAQQMRTIKAIACAILNLDYMKDGILHGYDPGDGYGGLHEPDMDKRTVMNNALLA